jgi:hypothetical protein
LRFGMAMSGMSSRWMAGLTGVILARAAAARARGHGADLVAPFDSRFVALRVAASRLKREVVALPVG